MRVSEAGVPMLPWLIALTIAVVVLISAVAYLIIQTSNLTMIGEILWARMRRYDNDTTDLYPVRKDNKEK